MDFKFSKDAEPEKTQSTPVEKRRQTSLLVLLLILVGGFSYLYFFTGLIRPQQEQKPAEAPAPQVIKKPLPSPAVQTAAVPTSSTGSSIQPTPGQAKPDQASTAPSAERDTKKEGEAQKTGTTNSPEKKPVPVAAAEKEQKPSSAAKAQESKKIPATMASAEKKAGPAAGAAKAPATGAAKEDGLAVKKASKEKNQAPAAGTMPKKASVLKPAKKAIADSRAAAGPWTVVVGTYSLEDAMATDMLRVRKAGLDASVQAGPRKKTMMNRLFLSEFPDRGAAQAELNKLKRHTSDAFVLDHGGSFGVYAGSYLLDGRAASEKERLAAAGFPLTLKKVDVAIPTKKLIAGKFDDKSAAEGAIRKLKEAGLRPALAH